MQEKSDYEGILTGKEQLGPFPMEKLKRVEQPTTRITDHVQRVDYRDGGFFRAGRGDFGPVVQKEGDRADRKYPLSFSLIDMLYRVGSNRDGEAAPSQAPIPQNPELLSRHIKSVGYFLRADIVAICPLPQWALYTYGKEGNPIQNDHKFAIVIVIDQDYETMSGSTGDDWISGAQAYLSYTTSAFVAGMMADYIRRLGYPARSHWAHGNYDMPLAPLLLLSGIGEICRAGMVLNPFLGTRFKAAVVTTDLPLEPDGPVDFGLQEFCQKCLKCATGCPAKAIPTGDKVMYNGYEIWKLDVERCTKYRVMNQNGQFCGRCIKVCPWNRHSQMDGPAYSLVRQILA
jgi:ferredoxin